MSRADDAPTAPAGPPGAARGGGWALPLLLVAAAGAALPELFDVDAFKTATVALLAAAVLGPWIALARRVEVREWWLCPGAWLLTGATLLALPAGLARWPNAALADRLLMLLLASTAAVLGVAAARSAGAGAGAGAVAGAGAGEGAARRAVRGDERDASRTSLLTGAGLAALGPLSSAMNLATLLTAVVVLLQAVGIEQHFSPPQADFLQRELVGLMGNSTRAGALLALGVTAAFCAVVTRGAQEREPRMRLALATLLLGTAALILSRARGGWLGAMVGLTAVALADLSATRAAARLWITRLALGIGLALLLAGGTTVLTQGKLPGSATLLSGGDVTTNVRLALWRGTADMIAARPLTGFGLGGFRAEFPPFRDPQEAALPGLGGARTEADHPHDEFLLAAAEGGLPAGLCLLLFSVLTCRRAWRGARVRAAAAPDGEAGPGERAAPELSRLALGVLLAGIATACVQNAWSTPGTALPFFAAAGCAWSGWRPAREGRGAWQVTRVAVAHETDAARTVTVAVVLVAMALLVVLALPRLDAHLRLRAFYQRADRDGINPQNFAVLSEAADADPGDVDVQRVLVVYGTQLAQALPAAGLEAEASQVSASVERARRRLAALAPHDPLPSAASAPRR